MLGKNVRIASDFEIFFFIKLINASIIKKKILETLWRKSKGDVVRIMGNMAEFYEEITFRKYF